MTKPKYLLIGLDGEMSTPDIQDGGQLIQVGLCIQSADGTYNGFSRLINPTPLVPFDDELRWSLEAQMVHQFTQEQILQDGLSPQEVDAQASDFLDKMLPLVYADGIPKNVRFVPVGFNVGIFDMPFIKKTLPNTYTQFVRREVDLNSLCYLVADATDSTYDRIRKKTKNYAREQIEQIKPQWREHDAGDDALLALLCLDYLKTLINIEALIS